MTEERLARYVELKAQEKEIAKEIDEIKAEIIATGKSEDEVGQYQYTVRENTRMDYNKDEVGKLIEEVVNSGKMTPEEAIATYTKETTYKVVKVK